MPQPSTPTMLVPHHTIPYLNKPYHIPYQSKALMPPDHTGHLPALIVAHSLFDHTWSLPFPSTNIGTKWCSVIKHLTWANTHNQSKRDRQPHVQATGGEGRTNLPEEAMFYPALLVKLVLPCLMFCPTIAPAQRRWWRRLITSRLMAKSRWWWSWRQKGAAPTKLPPHVTLPPKPCWPLLSEAPVCIIFSGFPTKLPFLPEPPPHLIFSPALLCHAP